MDFMNRGGRPVQQNTQTQTQAPDTNKSSGVDPKLPKFNNDKTKMFRIAYVVFSVLITIIIILVIAAIVSTKGGAKEKGFVDTTKYQAVFLNGGQVYFGKIGDLNSKYLSMDNIYYLRVNQQVQPDQKQNAAANDISLVKLGCELHGPTDNMVINREQVIFWENLKDDGQVAKAVAEYVKKNPTGEKCEQQQSTGTNTDANAPAAGTNTTGTGTGTTNSNQ